MLNLAKATNIVMLGALSKYFGIDDAIWKEAIEEAFASKPKTIPLNLYAILAIGMVISTSVLGIDFFKMKKRSFNPWRFPNS